MAVSAKVYGLALQSVLNKEINFSTDTVKALLCTSGYVPNQDTHRYRSSLTNELATTATTLSSAASAGAATISVAATIAAGNRITVGAGVTQDVRNVTAVTGAGPFTLTLDSPLTNAQSSGAAVQANPGYTAGGVTLGSKTVAYDAPSNTLTLDCADLSWSSSTLNARYLIVYVDTGTSSTSPLLCYVDFSTDQTTSLGTFTYIVPATGIAQFTAA